ncbi:MAG TPA: hypothetical protein VGN61_05445 [Verrucomicrobiae bacterium]
MLPDEGPSPEQIKILRAMTPAQRWRAAHQLYWTMRRHRAAFMRSQHPDWPESRIETEVREIFSHARLTVSAEEIILDVAEKSSPKPAPVDSKREVEFRLDVEDRLAELNRGEGVPVEDVKAKTPRGLESN